MTTADTAQSPPAKPPRATAKVTRQPKAVTGIKAAASKSDIVAKLLARPKGATIAEVSGATGWQAHSVRAFFSGLRKKGSMLEREARKDGTSSYRLMPTAAHPSTSAATTNTSPSDDGMLPAVTGGEA